MHAFGSKPFEPRKEEKGVGRRPGPRPNGEVQKQDDKVSGRDTGFIGFKPGGESLREPPS